MLLGIVTRARRDLRIPRCRNACHYRRASNSMDPLRTPRNWMGLDARYCRCSGQPQISTSSSRDHRQHALASIGYMRRYGSRLPPFIRPAPCRVRRRAAPVRSLNTSPSTIFRAVCPVSCDAVIVSRHCVYPAVMASWLRKFEVPHNTPVSRWIVSEYHLPACLG